MERAGTSQEGNQQNSTVLHRGEYNSGELCTSQTASASEAGHFLSDVGTRQGVPLYTGIADTGSSFRQAESSVASKTKQIVNIQAAPCKRTDFGRFSVTQHY